MIKSQVNKFSKSQSHTPSNSFTFLSKQCEPMTVFVKIEVDLHFVDTAITQRYRKNNFSHVNCGLWNLRTREGAGAALLFA